MVLIYRLSEVVFSECRDSSNRYMRTYSSIIIDKVRYDWFATQDDEHPDFCLVIKGGLDIWVQCIYLMMRDIIVSATLVGGRGKLYPMKRQRILLRR